MILNYSLITGKPRNDVAPAAQEDVQTMFAEVFFFRDGLALTNPIEKRQVA